MIPPQKPLNRQQAHQQKEDPFEVNDRARFSGLV